MPLGHYGQNHPSKDDPNAWVPYLYYLSKPAAVVGICAFAACTTSHAILLVRRRTWFFIPFILGGVLEAVGYGGRLLSSNDIWQLPPYIIQTIFLLVAPTLFAASICVVLGRLILHVDGSVFSLIPRRWITRLFVCGDVIAFLLQAGGGGYQAAGTASSLNIGNDIIIAGLFVQLVFFARFVIVSASFHVRFHHHHSSKSRHMDSVSGGEKLFRRQIFALYGGSGLILTRSLFRVIEYLQGNEGYLLRHEVFLYVFDGFFMLGVMMLFLFIHPSQLTTRTMQKTDSSSSERELNAISTTRRPSGASPKV